MKILMVISNFYPKVGGTEKQCFELSCALSAAGHQVTVFTRNTGGLAFEEEISGFKIKRAKVFGPLFFDSILFMIAVFREIVFGPKADIIHVHMISSFALAVLAAAKIRKIKTVFSVSGGKDLNEFTMSKKNFFGRIKLFIIKKSKMKILAKNSQVFQWLKSENLGKWEIILFKNGVDTLKYNVPLLDEKQKAKEKIGAFGFNFLFVGRLSWEKRIKEFLEVFAELISEEPSKKFNFIIVGDGPCKKDLEQAVVSLGIQKRVFILGQKYELRDFYFAGEVFVLPSISEGLSNSMLEAMSCGLALAASKNGGASEIIKNGENGCLFDPLNRKEIKNCLKQLLSCPDIKDMGKINRKIASEQFSMTVVAKELSLIYGD
ncbi:MAG: glycosyltransferase family 4 protein [Elusimicrobia bacterium]|nr:glycosyltransferase family 4 protein [Elusimicrobiota bacterium]